LGVEDFILYLKDLLRAGQSALCQFSAGQAIEQRPLERTLSVGGQLYTVELCDVFGYGAAGVGGWLRRVVCRIHARQWKRKLLFLKRF
jgi:hypothetical protein